MSAEGTLPHCSLQHALLPRSLLQFVFVGMMHVLYAIVLRSMGLEMSPMPAAVHRFVYRTEPPAAAAAPAAAPQAAG